MAKIVLVKTATLVANAGDKVSVHDDKVELTGPGYEGYTVVHVEGKTAAEVNAILNAKVPEQKTAHKLPVAGQWTFLEEKQVWKNSSGKWCDLVKRPKYPVNLKNLIESDITNLDSKLVNISTKEDILGKAQDNISLINDNLVEVSDLNK